MKQAFTMIELIFIIVIIGILGAVAVPKLTATRDDAKISAEITNAKITLTNLGAEFATKNAFVDYTEIEANEAVNCFTFETESDGNVTIDMITMFTVTCPNDIYTEVKSLATNTLLTSSGDKRTYKFGGHSIKR